MPSKRSTPAAPRLSATVGAPSSPPAAKAAVPKPASRRSVASQAAASAASAAAAVVAAAASQARQTADKAQGKTVAKRAGLATDSARGAAPAPSPPTPAAPAKLRRSNKRSEKTIETILACTEQIILESGADRISILDVCRAADVSRGTFYRYFASQDELLDAFSRHKRERFHRALQALVAPLNDPDERFAAVVAYLDNYLTHGKSRRLLVVAPEYALGFFRRIFHDSIVRFQDALSIVFDAWEERLGIQIDRELIAEMLIRYVLSEQLVPGDADRKSLPRRIGRMVEALLAGAPARARR